MENLDDISGMCTELGKAIAQTPAYQEFKKAEYTLLQNPEARKLVEDLQRLQQDQYSKQLAGQKPTQDDTNKLKEMELNCLKNDLVFQSNNANLRFQKFMEEISGKIKEGIKSVESL